MGAADMTGVATYRRSIHPGAFHFPAVRYPASTGRVPFKASKRPFGMGFPTGRGISLTIDFWKSIKRTGGQPPRIGMPIWLNPVRNPYILFCSGQAQNLQYCIHRVFALRYCVDAFYPTRRLEQYRGDVGI
jgi:hypothetical protein